VLDDLERTRPVLYRNVCDETGAVRRHLNIFVSADNVRDLAGLDTTLKSGDVVRASAPASSPIRIRSTACGVSAC
jgi:molybdopterin converting factor small subunit